jgi:hypothetical protein
MATNNSTSSIDASAKSIAAAQREEFLFLLKELPDEYVQELLVFSRELQALSLDGLQAAKR